MKDFLLNWFNNSVVIGNSILIETISLGSNCKRNRISETEVTNLEIESSSFGIDKTTTRIKVSTVHLPRIEFIGIRSDLAIRKVMSLRSELTANRNSNSELILQNRNVGLRNHHPNFQMMLLGITKAIGTSLEIGSSSFGIL